MAFLGAHFNSIKHAPPPWIDLNSSRSCEVSHLQEFPTYVPESCLQIVLAFDFMLAYTVSRVNKESTIPGRPRRSLLCPIERPSFGAPRELKCRKNGG